ncbi:DUF3667 domain-containing protein [Piscinibacter sp. XHJ-5]|uniref:DUF3667 domain-containing protein n=1 Tax=Piscinibacter sp. XHJ-5 TaxID=3037797 RepID=UPI0024528317|nr:DUF3667 domain-containing protein [Piscinibacter sp. XHJ-5]
MHPAANWTCPTCNQLVRTPFCARCGEEPIPPRDLTFRALLEKVVHALTNVDARAARTIRCLLVRPGELTLSWTRGVRKPHVAPFQLFLIANVMFFALQWLTGLNVFSSTLASHMHQQDWSELARSLVARRLEATHVPLDRYAPVFDRAVVLNAKSLILLMTLPFALLLPVVFLRARRPFMAHMVFSLHLYSFLLLLFCVGLLAAELSRWAGAGGLDSPRVDTVLSIALLIACSVYLYLAIGPVYQARGAMRVVQTMVLAIAVASIVLGYRFVLFLITLYGT